MEKEVERMQVLGKRAKDWEEAEGGREKKKKLVLVITEHD